MFTRSIYQDSQRSFQSNGWFTEVEETKTFSNFRENLADIYIHGQTLYN